jgi:transposase
MNPYTHSVGIDVSKATLDVRLWPVELNPTSNPMVNPTSKKRLHTSNDAAGHRQLIQWLDQWQAPRASTVICLEHTGRYDDVLLEHLTLSGWICAVEKTTVLEKVRPEHHRKDDPFDADLLAEYGYRYADKLHLYQAPDPVIEQIRLLYGERRRLVTQRAAVKQLQAEQGYNRAGRPSQAEQFAQKLWHQQRTFYDKQIKALEQQMQKLVRSDRALHRRYEQLKGIDGIGPQASLLCLFYGQVHLNARRIASRFGFAPHSSRSGTSRDRGSHSTGHGKKEVRKILTMCARSAGTHHEKYRQYKGRKLAEGKASQLVTNNMINKLIRVVCAVWNQDAEYDRSHVSRFVQNAASVT